VTLSMMPATSSTYVQHALWNYPSHALREQKTKLLTARGPGSTVSTASLRKSAEPAYWPRRGPALGQRCTRAGERSAGGRRHSAGRRRLPNLPKHTSPDPQMPQYPRKGAIRAGFQICVITSWRYMGLAGTRGRIVIKQSNAAQKSNNQNPTNTTFPSHSFSESKQSKSRENPGKKKTLVSAMWLAPGCRPHRGAIAARGGPLRGSSGPLRGSTSRAA